MSPNGGGGESPMASENAWSAVSLETVPSAFHAPAPTARGPYASPRAARSASARRSDFRNHSQ